MLPCNLILEGVGKVGKTTLIKGIVESIQGIRVYNYKMPVPSSVEDGYSQYEQYWREITNNDNNVVIFDRGHISELVYAPVYRNYFTNSYYTFLQDIDQSIALNSKVPTYIIYVYPRWQSIMTPGTRITDDLIAIPRLYEEILGYTKIKTIRISTHRKYTALWRPQYEIVTELLNKIEVS